MLVAALPLFGGALPLRRGRGSGLLVLDDLSRTTAVYSAHVKVDILSVCLWMWIFLTNICGI